MMISLTDSLRKKEEEVVFERQRLIDRCMGKLELAERLLKLLVDGLPSDLLELQKAVEEGEISRVASLSHRMKGTASNMCAERLSMAAANLERAARCDDRKTVTTSWLELHEEVGVLLEALRR